MEQQQWHKIHCILLVARYHVEGGEARKCFMGSDLSLGLQLAHVQIEAMGHVGAQTVEDNGGAIATYTSPVLTPAMPP